MRVPDKKTKAFRELIGSQDNRRDLRRRTDLAVEAKLPPNLVSLLEELERLEQELGKLEQGLAKKNHG